MALTTLMMIKACQRIAPGARVAAMGYPDLIAPPERIAALLGDKLARLQYRSDSQAICQRHFGYDKEPRPIPDAHSFFSLLGATLDVFDIVKERGCEILCDLNHEMVTTREYDIVLDVGTIEHCFNIGQAAINMARMVKRGGAIFHTNPFNIGNHGLYNLNPTWYADFYGANGFRVEDLRLLPRRGGQVNDVERTARFGYFEGEANLYCCAVRDEVKAFVYPHQGRYRKLIERAA